MTRLFLHIGIAKSGTSAIQHFLFNNRELLASHHVYYPTAGLFVAAKAHHYLSHKWGSWRNTKYLTGVDFDAEWQKLERFIAGHEGVHIVSSEGFSVRSVLPEKEDLVPYVRDVLRDVDMRIVVYLRPQDEWVESMYKQMVGDGRMKRTFRSFLDDLPRELDFDYLLKIWEAGFSRQNIIVLRYARSQFANGDVASDFLRALSIPPIAGLVRTERDVNPSLDDITAQLLRVLGQSNRGRIGKRLTHLSSRLFGGLTPPESLRLSSPEQRRMIRERYASSNAQVAERYFPGEGTELFPTPEQRLAG